MRQILLAAAAVIALIAPLKAQQPVNSTSVQGVITTTNTFQTALAAPTTPGVRHGCSIQNLGANNMFVNFGSATPVSYTSIKLVTGAIVRCDAGGVVLQDTIQISGTAGDVFLVISQ